MRKQAAIAVLAVLGGALMLSSPAALARDSGGVLAKPAAHSSSRSKTRGWIHLHRLDGEVVHINVEHIVFVANAKNTGGNERAKSRVQLVNGFSDVLETVDEVMQSIKHDDLPEPAAGAVLDDIMSSPRIGGKED